MSGKKSSPIKPLELEGRRFAPGTRTRLMIPLAQLYVQTPIEMPVIVVQGVRPGPRLLVSSAIHGDEINGIFSIQRILAAVDPKQLAGTLILVPVVNLFGVIQQTRYLPDRRDLNRCFPGSARGSLSSSLAHTFMKKVVRHITHSIDLHTAAIHRTNWPQVRANLDDPETYRLAKAFGAHLMIHANERDGSLRQAANQKGIPSLLFEGGAALRHDEEAVQMGTDGVLRVMRALGMSEKAPENPRKKSLESRKSCWVRAEQSGFFVPSCAPGKKAKKNQPLGKVWLRLHTDFAPEIEIEVVSPFSGVVIGVTENPMVYRGDALIHVAQL
jgi:predicted deacylase